MQNETDVIECEDLGTNELLRHIPNTYEYFKTGNKILVRDGQVAILTQEWGSIGKFYPGLHEISEINIADFVQVIPEISDKKRSYLKSLFSTAPRNFAFKAELFFINTSVFSDLKWKTKQPILIGNDASNLISLSAEGTYSFLIGDHQEFLYRVKELNNQPKDLAYWNKKLQNLLIPTLGDVIHETNQLGLIKTLGLRNEIAAAVRAKVQDEFAAMAISLRRFSIIDIRPDKKTQEQITELRNFQQNINERGGVFISHSHADKDIVDKIVKRFDKDKISYWLDDKDLLVGDVMDEAISIGIQNSWIFLLILTPSSIKSGWVKRELDEASYEAIEGRKVILPAIAKGLKIKQVPARLRKNLYADLTTNFDIGYTKLKKSILARSKRSNL